MRTREPELRRKRCAVDVERSLLGHSRPPKRAPHRHTTKRARRTAELMLDDLAVVHCDLRLLLVTPGGDAAHDEELFPRLDEPELARLADQLVARPDGCEPLLERSLLLLQA